MTNEEIKQKSIEIAKKYYDIMNNTEHINYNRKAVERSAIQCAITEVESNIELLSKLDYETDFMGYKAILEHLKNM
jgi:hypothetical protein